MNSGAVKRPGCGHRRFGQSALAATRGIVVNRSPLSASRGIWFTIAKRSDMCRRGHFDKAIYQERNHVERLFNRFQTIPSLGNLNMKDGQQTILPCGDLPGSDAALVCIHAPDQSHQSEMLSSLTFPSRRSSSTKRPSFPISPAATTRILVLASVEWGNFTRRRFCSKRTKTYAKAQSGRSGRRPDGARSSPISKRNLPYRFMCLKRTGDKCTKSASLMDWPRLFNSSMAACM
jgi:hypothetical protein